MSTLAEQLRDAIAAYRKADDAGDERARAVAFDRMRRVHDQIAAANAIGARQ